MSDFSFVEHSVKPIQTSDQTLLVIAYELTAVNLHLTVPATRSVPAAKIELADLISTTRMYCEQKELPFPVPDGSRVSELSGLSDSGLITAAWLAYGRLAHSHHYDRVYGENNHIHGKCCDGVTELVAVEMALAKVSVEERFNRLMELGEEKYLDRMRDITKYGRGHSDGTN